MCFFLDIQDKCLLTFEYFIEADTKSSSSEPKYMTLIQN